MLRRLSTLLSVVSLLLTAAVCVLWARSYHRSEFVSRTSARALTRESGAVVVRRVVCAAGVVYVECHEASPVGVQSDTVSWDAGRIAEPYHWPDRTAWGVSYQRRVKSSRYVSSRAQEYGISFWLLFAAMLFPPTAVQTIRIWRQSQAAKRGLCRSCGYDVRATPARCPECGTAGGGTAG